MGSRGSHDAASVIVRDAVQTVLAADVTLASGASTSLVTMNYPSEPNYDRLTIIGSKEVGTVPVLNIVAEIAVDGVTFAAGVIVGTIDDLDVALTGPQTQILGLASLLTPGVSAIRLRLTNASGTEVINNVRAKAVFENPFYLNEGAP